MVRLPCAWTVHDTHASKLAAPPALPSRQGTALVCPAPPTSTLCATGRPSFSCSCLPRCATSASPPPTASGATHPNHSKPHLRRHDFRSYSETKPIKDPASVCGLVHCTVSSLSRRSALSFPFSALARRETDETFISHRSRKIPRPMLSTTCPPCPRRLTTRPANV
jgi:hypothetical protein